MIKHLLLVTTALSLAACACCKKQKPAATAPSTKPTVANATSLAKKAAASTPQGQAASQAMKAADAAKKAQQ